MVRFLVVGEKTQMSVEEVGVNEIPRSYLVDPFSIWISPQEEDMVGLTEACDIWQLGRACEMHSSLRSPSCPGMAPL